nr:MAG TPA: hypothetical protein [Caudoviricetes sp.]
MERLDIYCEPSPPPSFVEWMDGTGTVRLGFMKGCEFLISGGDSPCNPRKPLSSPSRDRGEYYIINGVL